MVFTSSPREPDAPESVVVWPWRVVDEALSRDTPTAGSGTRLVVSYLVFSDSLERLDAVRLCLATNPIVMEADAPFAIVSEPLGMEQQLQLFMAAGLRPRPCLSYAVQAGVASAARPATPGPARAGLFLYAKDLSRLADFYQSLLGMARRHSTGEVVVLGSPDIQLTLHAIPAAIAATITLQDPPEHFRGHTVLDGWDPEGNIVQIREPSL